MAGNICCLAERKKEEKGGEWEGKRKVKEESLLSALLLVEDMELEGISSM